MKPKDVQTVRKREPALDRVMFCKSLLYLHGFLTEAESARIHKRMVKWIEKYTDHNERF